MKTRVENTMKLIKNQLETLVDELMWIPALLENHDQSTKLSWYLIIQHDLAKQAFYAFGRCGDEHYKNDCLQWQRGGGLELTLHYTTLYQAILAEIVLIDQTLTDAIARRLKDLREKWSPLLTASYNELYKWRPAQTRTDITWSSCGRRGGKGGCDAQVGSAKCVDKVDEWKSLTVSGRCQCSKDTPNAHNYCMQRMWSLQKAIKDEYESRVNAITGAAPAPPLGPSPAPPPPPPPRRRTWVAPPPRRRDNSRTRWNNWGSGKGGGKGR